MPCFARPRTAASLSPATSPVASIRSATSSASSLTGKDAGSSPLPASCLARPERSFGGRLRSMGSLERGIGRTLWEGKSLERAQIRVQEHVACKERDDRAEGQERGEGDAHLAGGGSVARYENEARDEPGDHPDHQADGDVPAEHRPEQQGELDVAHAHPAGIRERGDEQEAGGAEGAERRSGTRAAITFTKLPSARAGQNASTPRATSTSALSAAGRHRLSTVSDTGPVRTTPRFPAEVTLSTRCRDTFVWVSGTGMRLARVARRRARLRVDRVLHGRHARRHVPDRRERRRH